MTKLNVKNYINLMLLPTATAKDHNYLFKIQ